MRSTNVGAMFSFTRDQFGTRGVRPALLAMTLVMPSTAPPNRLIRNDTEPRQCAITWIRRPSPTTLRSVRSAAG